MTTINIFFKWPDVCKFNNAERFLDVVTFYPELDCLQVNGQFKRRSNLTPFLKRIHQLKQQCRNWL